MAKSDDTQLTIVGGGRIGGMLADLAAAAGQPHVVVGRSGPTTAATGRGPVVVCTRNDALDDVIGRTPDTRRGDLVFVQNGVLAPWLAARGLADTTLGVLFVAVDAVGATPVPGAPSVFGGPHAARIAGLLNGGGVTARAATSPDDLRAAVGVKIAWICILGVLGDALDLKVGPLVDDHADDIAALCRELAPVLAACPHTAAPDDLVAQVIDYSRSVRHYRTAVKEWDWRTGWLLDEATRAGVDLPLHRAWLARAGHG